MVMSRYADEAVVYAPFYMYSFRLVQPHTIVKMREKRGMTQREFARRLGVPYGTLQQWEQNRVQMFKSAWKN